MNIRICAQTCTCHARTHPSCMLSSTRHQLTARGSLSSRERTHARTLLARVFGIYLSGKWCMYICVCVCMHACIDVCVLGMYEVCLH